MTTYFVLGSVLLAMSTGFGFNFALRRINVLVACGLIPIACCIAITRSAGTDYQLYFTHFDELSQGTDGIFAADGGAWEKGFVALSAIFSALSLPYDALMAFSLFVSLALCLWVAEKYSKNLVQFAFSLFCLCFLFISFVRQDLAVALSFLAFHFAMKRQFWRFAMTSSIAASIHLSAVPVLFIIFLVSEWRHGRLLRFFNPRPIMALAASGLLIYYLIDFDRIQTQISVYAAEGFVQGVVDEQVSAARNVSKFVSYMVFASLVVIFQRRKFDKGFALSLATWNIYVLSVVGIVLSQISPVFSRLSLFIFPFMALAYSSMFSRSGGRSLICILLASAYLVAYFIVSFIPLAEWM